MDDLPDRVPPHNIDAEVTVLGSMILDPTKIQEARELLTAEDFYRPAHPLIFLAICALADALVGIDLVTLRDQMERDGTLQQCGGIEYITDVVQGVPSYEHLPHYAGIVKRASSLRRLISAGSEIASNAWAPAAEPSEILEAGQQRLYDIAVGQEGHDGQVMLVGKAAGIVLAEAFKAHREGRPPGIQTGIPAYDEATCGISPTDYVILGGITGSGKTTLALGYLAAGVCEAGGGVLYISCEMWPALLTARLICGRADVANSKLKRGEMEKDEWKAVKEAADDIATWKLEIVGRGSTVAEIGSRARAAATRWKRLDLIVVDYLQHMKGRGKDRREAITNISSGLKELTTSMGVPVLAVAQVTRQVGKEKIRPTRYHLKEAGDIENDADVVLLLHQPEKPKWGPEPFSAEAAADDRAEGKWEEVWARLDKGRNSPETAWPDHAPAGAASIKFRWFRNVTRFENW